MVKKLSTLLLLASLFSESGGRNSGGPTGQGYAHNAPNFNNCKQRYNVLSILFCCTDAIGNVLDGMLLLSEPCVLSY